MRAGGEDKQLVYDGERAMPLKVAIDRHAHHTCMYCLHSYLHTYILTCMITRGRSTHLPHINLRAAITLLRTPTATAVRLVLSKPVTSACVALAVHLHQEAGRCEGCNAPSCRRFQPGENLAKPGENRINGYMLCRCWPGHPTLTLTVPALQVLPGLWRSSSSASNRPV